MPSETAGQSSSVHVTAECIMATRSLLDPAAAHQGMWPGARDHRGPEDTAPCQAHRFSHLLAFLWRQRRCLLHPRPTCERRGSALRPPRVSFISVPQTEGPCHLAWGLPSGWWPGCRAGRPMATLQLWVLPPRSGTHECAHVCVHMQASTRTCHLCWVEAARVPAPACGCVPFPTRRSRDRRQRPPWRRCTGLRLASRPLFLGV